jgi:hypothetical protein
LDCIGPLPIEQYEKAFASGTMQGVVIVIGARIIAEEGLQTYARPSPAPSEATNVIRRVQAGMANMRRVVVKLCEAQGTGSVIQSG